MKIISASINLSKLDKSKLITGKDGVTKYANIQIFLNSEPDQYGNHASISENQSKEEREAKAPKNYIGNGKVVFSNSPDTTATAATKTEDNNDLPW